MFTNSFSTNSDSDTEPIYLDNTKKNFNKYNINPFINVIENIIEINKKLFPGKWINTINQGKSFIINEKPDISIKKFIERLLGYLNPENSTFITTLILIDHLLSKNIYLTENNCLKIILAGLLISFKLNEDEIYNNKFFALVGGVNINELNKIEFEFISTLEFNLFITDKEFHQYENYFN